MESPRTTTQRRYVELLPYFGSDTNACAGGRDTTLWLMKVVTKFLGADERISARRIVGSLVL